jgi:hypothetical protein
MPNGRRVTAALFLFATLVVVTAPAVQAHHSTAAYQDKTITVRNAVVKRLGWSNPHCILTFEAKDERGQVKTWNIESGSPSALSRIGWHRNSVKSGDRISVELFPAKNGAPVGRLARIVLADGKELADSLYKDSPFETIQKK